MQDQGRLQLPALLQVFKYCESDLEHEHSTKLDASAHMSVLLQVFEYCESDLEQLIKDRRTLLSAADIKAYMAHDPGGPALLPPQLGAAPGHQAQQLPHHQAGCAHQALCDVQ